MIEELKNKKIKIKFGPTEQITVKYGTRAKEVLELLDIEDKDVLAVKINNSVRNLDYNLCENSIMSLVRFNSSDGHRIYIRTVKFMLYMALSRLYPNVDVEVCNIQDENIYFICHNMEFTDDMAVELLKEMRTIVKNDSKFQRRVVTYEEAKYLFELSKNEDAIDTMAIRMTPRVTIHMCEDVYGIADGILAYSASYTPDFNIKKFRRGFALIVPAQDKRDVVKTKIEENPLYSVFEERSDFLDIIEARSISEVNSKVIDGTIKDVIHVNEAEQNRRFEELILDIKAKGKKKMVMIAGPS